MKTPVGGRVRMIESSWFDHGHGRGPVLMQKELLATISGTLPVSAARIPLSVYLLSSI